MVNQYVTMGKEVSSINGAGKLGIHMQNYETGPLP